MVTTPGCSANDLPVLLALAGRPIFRGSILPE